jgi:gluconolactonase
MRLASLVLLLAGFAGAADVPKGVTTQHTFNASKIFPGTTRDYWVYVPARYDGAKPACLMVFQDGGRFVADDSAWRVRSVFDALIAEGAMPVTIAVFVDPGETPAAAPSQMSRFNRSYEYDGLSDRYARFLIDELLPEIAGRYRISSDPNDRAIAGASSGGIAAFAAAWNRPDAFRRVMSFIGSFTNLRGGDVYANLIRKMEPLPLRVFLEDGSADLNIYAGSWFLANQSVAKSLEFAGYDVRFEAGTGGHDSTHGAAIFADALRWLWRDYPKPIAAGRGSSADRHFITEILDPASDWEVEGEGFKFTEGPAADRAGTLYFCDAEAARIYRIGAGGKPELFKEDSGGATGLAFGADGRLYVAENVRQRVVAYSPDGRLSVLASGVTPNDLTVTAKGDLYFTDSRKRQVWRIDVKGAKHLVFDGAKDGNLLLPNGVRVNPDESLLAVADTVGRSAWSFRIQPDGTLSAGEPFYHLEIPDDVANGPLRSGADGMAFDDQGHLYIATKLGIQICDQPGRVVGIIRNPGPVDTSNVVFGGPDMQTLYVTTGDKIYRRHLRRKGVAPGQVVKLPRPQL